MQPREAASLSDSRVGDFVARALCAKSHRGIHNLTRRGAPPTALTPSFVAGQHHLLLDAMAAAPPAAPAFKNYERAPSPASVSPFAAAPAAVPTRSLRSPRTDACEALLKTVTLLEKDQEELQKLIAEAGDNQQMKMSKVIPQLQKTMGGALPEYGFPPPPAGVPRRPTPRPCILPRARPPRPEPTAEARFRPLPHALAPAPSAGILMAVMAFKNIADASTLGDDCPVKNGLAMLKDAMMGKTPSPEQIAAIKAGLEAQAK